MLPNPGAIGAGAKRSDHASLHSIQGHKRHQIRYGSKEWVRGKRMCHSMTGGGDATNAGLPGPMRSDR